MAIQGPQLTVTATSQHWEMLKPGLEHFLDNRSGANDVYFVAHLRGESAVSISGTATELDAEGAVTRVNAGGIHPLESKIQSVSIVRASDAANVTVRQGVGRVLDTEPRLAGVVDITVSDTASDLDALVTAAGATLPGDLAAVQLSGDDYDAVKASTSGTATGSSPGVPSGRTSDYIPMTKTDAESYSMYAAASTTVTVRWYR